MKTWKCNKILVLWISENDRQMADWCYNTEEGSSVNNKMAVPSNMHRVRIAICYASFFKFLEIILTGNETWAHYSQPEKKRARKEW